MIEEPILKKKKTNKNRYIFFSILTLFLFVGVSYGLIFFVQEYQGSSLGLKTEILSVDISSDGVVTLDDALPQKDADGLNNDKTTFSITNNSNTAVKVVISLEEDATSTMDSNSIRFGVLLGNNIVNLGNLGENDDVLYEFNLGEGQEIYIDSTIWIDYYYSGSGETFSAKYKVEASNIDEYGYMYLKNIVGKNKGLYGVNEDGTLNDGTTEPYEYRYSGLNPDNYINFNNETWRIIGIVEGNIKIVKDEVIDASAFGNTNLYEGSIVETTLNTYYDGLIDEYKEMVYPTAHYVGSVGLTDTYATLRTNEKLFYDKISVGLISASDYLYSTSIDYYTSALNDTNVSGNSWLSGTYLTLTPITDTTTNILGINANIPTSISVTDAIYNLKPCLYLKNNVAIIAGDGSENNPYEVTLINDSSKEYVNYADANVDGEVTMDDALVIMQYLNNINTITEQGLKNADVNDDGMINNNDANLINMYFSGYFDDADIPNSSITNYVMEGDVNEDGNVDATDEILLTKYVAGKLALSVQSLKNSDMNADGTVDNSDVTELASRISSQ